MTDDIKTLGDSCTTLGGCPGKLACDADKKSPVCVPDGATKLEICNGVDDDCDGSIDETDDVSKNDPAIGVVCDAVKAPNDQPPCASGHTVCVNGNVDCQGAVHPLKEVCDLKDNDCDGVADTLAACPGGNACIEGQCDEPCHGGEFPCPGGYDCKAYDGKKYCVPQDCVDANCPQGAHCRNNRCTLDGQGAGGDGNVAGAGNGEAGMPASAGAPSAEGGEGNAVAGNGTGNESSGGEGNTSGGSTSTGATSNGATGNEAPDNHGVYGVVTGGGGCACRTTPSRGGHVAFAASLLLLGALVRRRRGAQGRRAA
jgi:MYXO-CTERM domain-containing protein